jgi:hypothetical protein
VLEPPAVASLNKAQQAGLWFGEGQDDHVKVHLFNDAGGWVVETVRELDGVFGNGPKSPVLNLAGKSVRLKLTADPATRKVAAHYEVSGAVEQRLGEWDVPAAFFNQDVAAIDNRTGTSSFAGLFASHRNGEGPLVFRFADFGVATDATQQRPSIANVSPAAGATGVFRDAGINMGLTAPNGSVDNRTITADTLRLERVSDSVAIETVRGTSGGGDALTMQPVAALAANTQYRIVVTDGLKDLTGAAFVPFTSTFTTGAVNKPTGTGSTAKFTKVLQPTATAPQYHGFTSLEMEPTTGDQLYALRNDGLIKRFPRAADGTLGTPEELTGLRDYAQRKFGTPDRLATGMVFDPASTQSSPVVWITHTVLGFADMADWTGEITRLSGANLQNATTYVVGLPRSARDHVSNSLVFRNGKLYFPQGSNSAMGEADAGWGWRRERMLTGAILELDPAKITSPPLNVKTPEPAPVRADGRDDPNLPDFCKPLDGKPATKPNDPACSDPVVRTPGTYDPFAANAALKIHATGIRNAYDLLWHSSGRLYTAANGSADGGNSPATPAAGSRPEMCASRIDGRPFSGTFTSSTGAYAGGAAPEILNIEKQHEWLFRVEPGGYYGHPNPRRCEYVMNGGNPTTGIDVGEVLKYPAGKVEPDPNYRGAAFDIGYNKSPNGTIEYKSNRFGGSLAGKLLIVRYSNDDDVLVLDPREADGDVPADGWQTLPGASAFRDPLDLIEDEDGGVYVSEYDQLGNGPKITYLKPDETGTNPTGCDPVSTLPCSQVKVADTHAKAYDPATDAGGLKDADGQGTGFTMVQPNTAGDQYQPADLDVTGGALTLTAQKGIQFKSATTGGSGAFNALKNGLGVGLDGTRKVRLETTLVNPPAFADSSSQQAGLWFGPDQDNYVKLVVANRGGYPGRAAPARAGRRLDHHRRGQPVRDDALAAAELVEHHGPARPRGRPGHEGRRGLVPDRHGADPAARLADARHGPPGRLARRGVAQGERHRELRRHLRLQAQRAGDGRRQVHLRRPAHRDGRGGQPPARAHAGRRPHDGGGQQRRLHRRGERPRRRRARVLGRRPPGRPVDRPGHRPDRRPAGSRGRPRRVRRDGQGHRPRRPRRHGHVPLDDHGRRSRARPGCPQGELPERRGRGPGRARPRLRQALR